MTDETVQQVSIRQGSIYRYNPTGLTYLVVGFAKDWPSKQEKVVYLGMDGFDEGQYHVCSLMDFVIKMAPLDWPQPVPEPKDVERDREYAPPDYKVAGFIGDGSGA